MSLRDRRPAVVSGAGSGIGRAIALELARRGHPLLLLGRTSPTLEATLTAAGGEGIALTCDVRSAAEVEAALARTAASGVSPEIVVPAAGVARVGRLETLDESDLRESLETNLLGALHLFRACLPRLRTSGSGHLFVLLSVAALRGFDGWSAYCASKWGLRGAVEALREELAGTDIRLTAIVPGATDSPLWNGVPGTWNRSAMLPARRVAEAVVWALEASRDAAVEEIRLQPPGGNL